MAGYFRNSIFRIREVTVNGTTTVVGATPNEIFVCYENFDFDPGPVQEELLLSCNAGAVDFTSYFKPTWSLTFPPNFDQLTLLNGYLNSAQNIGFEIIQNPILDDGSATLAANLVIEVVRFSVVGSRPDSHPGKGLVKRTVNGAGGIYYREQVGRTGLPAPYNAA